MSPPGYEQWQPESRVKIHECIAEFAETRPDHPAIVTGDEVVSYATLLRAASSLSKKLRQHVPAGCLIALYEEMGVPYLRNLLAVLLADCAYVPLDTHDGPEHILVLGLETGTTALLTSEVRLPELSVLPRAASIKLGRSLHLLSFSPHALGETFQKGRGFRRPNMLKGFEEADLANVIFTSGSGGHPKAIARSHAAIVEHTEAWTTFLTPEERSRFMLACSPAFSMSMTAIFLAWLSGETLVLPPHGWSHNPRLLADCITGHRVTGLKIIPSTLPRLATALGASSTNSCPQVVIVSGEKATWDQVNAWREVAPRCRVLNTYGLTEAFSVTAYEVPDNSTSLSGGLPIGKPVLGNHIMVLDERLHVRGNCLAAGRVLATRLEPLPFIRQDGEVWFRTMDSGSLDSSGVFHFSSRLDANIKSRGYLIDPVTIEQVLTNQLGIAEAAVTKCPDSDQLVALLVLDGEELDVRSLRVFLSSRLRSFEIPQIFRAVNTIPKLRSGKIDRASCDPQFGRVLVITGSFGPQPFTEVESRISEIVEERLGASPLGIDQSWYDLGGDSLGLQDLVLALETEFKVLLDADLSPFTIRRLTELVEKAPATRYAHGGSAISYVGPLAVRSPQELLDPLRHWEHFQINDSRTDPYTISQRRRLQRLEKMPFDQTSVRLEFFDRANVEHVGETLAELVASHDGLRRFLSPETREQVTYLVSGDLLLPVVDASDLSARHTDSLIHRFFAMPLDPDSWPAMRWMLVRKRGHDLFLWQLSHTLVDLASTDVLARQFLEIYTSLGKGRRERPAAQNRTGDWHREVEAIRYPDEVISWSRETMSRYCQLVSYCKAALVKRCLKTGDMTHRYTRRGNYQEVFIEDAFDRVTPVASLLAPYVFALSRWLGVSGVPLRVGSSARDYPAFENSFSDTVGQFNDHFLLPLSTPWDGSVAEIEVQLRGYFNFIRQHSINFDKIVEALRSQGNPYFATLPTLVAAAPLGDLTARESEEGTVRTVPRPLWGRWSFNPGGRGAKIGIYTFRNGESVDLLVYSKGVWSRAFKLFIEELRTWLPVRAD